MASNVASSFGGVSIDALELFPRPGTGRVLLVPFFLAISTSQHHDWYLLRRSVQAEAWADHCSSLHNKPYGVAGKHKRHHNVCCSGGAAVSTL